MRSFTICYNRSAAAPNRQKITPSLLQGNNTPRLFYGKFILLAIIMVLVCGNAQGQTRVQAKTGSTGGSAANTFTVTLNSTPANGNTLIAVVSTRGNSDSRVNTITQTGATWTRAVQKTNTNGVTTEIWYASNTASAVTAVKINLAASLFAAAVVMEYSGILTASPLDQTASATGSNSNPVTGTSPFTTQANELWIGGIGLVNSNYTIVTPTNSFTNVTFANSNSSSWWWLIPENDAKVYALEKVVTSIGQASTGGTLSTSSQWSGVIATFKKQPPPTITGFTPTSGCTGSTITINGTNLSGATAANVKIGATAATSITSNNGTTIVATIIPTATGKVTVTTPGGTATSADNFIVSSSAPTAAVVITGTENVCQGSNNITYTVPAISGATSYIWSYLGAGATLNGSANTVVTTTNSVSINFSATATTGFLNVKGQSPCGVGAVSPNFAIQVNSLPPDPIPPIITNENCPGDKDGAIKLKIPTALIFDGPIPGVTKAVSNQDGNPTYNDGVNLNGSFLNNLTGFTVEGWVNTDVTVGNVSLFGQNDIIEMGFLNNKVELYSKRITSSTGNYVSDIVYPIDGKWHHIAGTGDKLGMTIYIDGNPQKRWTYTYPKDTVLNYGSNTNNTWIARQVFDNTDLQPFTGQIVKVGFWNYAMTQAEITALAGGGFRDYKTTDAGLIAGYNFYETTGDVTLEPVSNTTTIPMGTLVNTPRWNEVYDYVWTKTDGGTYGGASTKNIKLIERGLYNVTVASKFGCGTNSATFTVTGKNNYWTGAISTDWSNKDNWTCGVVRDGKDVVFATSVNNPAKPASKNLELLDGSHTINNLTNATSLATVIPPARALTVQGAISGSETDPTKILIQANDTQPNGSLIFTNPQLNPVVKATVQMYARGLKGTPWSWNDPVSGQTFSGSYRWQFFGVPVSDSGTLASNSSLWGSYIRKYNENKNLNAYYQKWTDLGNNDILTPFTGYEITQDVPKTVSFSGTLVTGDRTLPLTKTTGSTLNYGSGYNIFGNSFTAPIDITKLIFGDDVDATVHIYNTGSLKEWGNAPRGGTQAVVGAYMAISKGLAGIGIPRDIPSMQGFLVKVKDTGGANATVTIPYIAVQDISVIPGLSLQHVKRSESEEDISYMTVDVTGTSGVDRVWLYSVPGKSHGYDNGYDGEKIMLATGVALYADELSGKYQLNAAEDLDETYLAFRAGNESDYTLKVDKSKLNGYETLYLRDLITGTEINLSAVDTASYQFSASNSQVAEKRFVLTRRSKTGIEPNSQHLITIYSAGKTIWLNNMSDSQGIVEAFELTGKQIYSGTIQAQQQRQIELNLPDGVYVIKAKTEDVNVVRKVLIGKNQ